MLNSFTIRQLCWISFGFLVWGNSGTKAIAEVHSPDTLLAQKQTYPVITPTTPAAKEKVSQGLQLIQQGQLPQAIAMFREAIQLDPRFWQAHYNLGLALRQSGDPQGAAQAFYNTVTLQPEFALGYANVGGILVDVQNWAQAQNYLQRALELDPNLAIAHYNMGLIYRQAGRMDAAVASWEKARQLSPNLVEASIQLAEVYLNGDRPKDAQKLVEEVISIQPQMVAAHYLRGRIAEAQGNFNAALDSFRRASTLDPAYANAYFGAAKVLIANQRANAAIPLLDYALFLYNQQGQTTWANEVKTLRQQIN